MSATTPKLVVIAPNWLGDAVMSLPLVGAMGAADGVSLAVMAPAYTARVYQGVDGVDELIVVDGSGRAGRIRSQARALRAVGADAAAVLPPSFSSALSAWLARTPVRVGLASDARGMLLTDSLPVPAREDEHLSETYVRIGLRALERLGEVIPPTAARPRPRLRVFERDEGEAGSVLAHLGVGAGAYVTMAPGATFGPAKSWPENRFREVARAIAEDLPVVLVGGSGDVPRCERIADGLDAVHDAAGQTSLGAFFAVIAGSSALVANDSGPPHVGGALGVPVVALFGSTSPRWTRPLGEEVAVIRHAVHCSPCFRRTCPTQLECFGGIGVDEVATAVRAALKKGVAQTHPGF